MAVAAEIRRVEPTLGGVLDRDDVIHVEGSGATLDAEGMLAQMAGAQPSPVRVVTTTMCGAALALKGPAVFGAHTAKRGAARAGWDTARAFGGDGQD